MITEGELRQLTDLVVSLNHDANRTEQPLKLEAKLIDTNEDCVGSIVWCDDSEAYVFHPGIGI